MKDAEPVGTVEIWRIVEVVRRPSVLAQLAKIPTSQPQLWQSQQEQVVQAQQLVQKWATVQQTYQAIDLWPHLRKTKGEPSLMRLSTNSDNWSLTAILANYSLGGELSQTNQSHPH
ncbi:hypothetical protein QUF63_02175 [Anaerolineales bacterium HSG25]|nr:hypothetical protein [Anaerolineales bacterium HSG25]